MTRLCIVPIPAIPAISRWPDDLLVAGLQSAESSCYLAAMSQRRLLYEAGYERFVSALRRIFFSNNRRARARHSSTGDVSGRPKYAGAFECTYHRLHASPGQAGKVQGAL